MKIFKWSLVFILIISVFGCATFNRPIYDVQLGIASEPSGARVYEEGKLLGNTPLTLSYRFEIIPKPIFGPSAATKPGGSYKLTHGQSSANFAETLGPDEKMFSSDSRGGQDTKALPYRLDGPPPPPKSFTAIKDGYRAQTKIFRFSLDEIHRGETNFSILFLLEPLEAKPQQQQQQQQQQTTAVIPGASAITKTFGTLTILTTPAQAEVYIDGTFVATTPAPNLQLEAGPHKIEIQKSGYKTWARTMQVLANSPVKIEIELEKIAGGY
jgi:hypothetical protein